MSSSLGPSSHSPAGCMDTLVSGQAWGFSPGTARQGPPLLPHPQGLTPASGQPVCSRQLPDMGQGPGLDTWQSRGGHVDGLP